MKSENVAFKVVVSVLCGILGLLINRFFSFNMYFGIDMLFGGIISIIPSLIYGPLYGLISAFIASFYTISLWGHPLGVFLFCFEAVFVGFFSSRKESNDGMLYSAIHFDLIYWLLVTAPIHALFYTYVIKAETLSILLIILKNTLNGAVNITIAEFITYGKPLRRFLKVGEGNYSARKYFLHIVVLCICICSIGVLFTNRTIFFYTIKENMDEQLVISSQAVEDELRYYDEKVQYELDVIKKNIQYGMLDLDRCVKDCADRLGCEDVILYDSAGDEIYSSIDRKQDALDRVRGIWRKVGPEKDYQYVYDYHLKQQVVVSRPEQQDYSIFIINDVETLIDNILLRSRNMVVDAVDKDGQILYSGSSFSDYDGIDWKGYKVLLPDRDSVLKQWENAYIHKQYGFDKYNIMIHVYLPMHSIIQQAKNRYMHTFVFSVVILIVALIIAFLGSYFFYLPFERFKETIDETISSKDRLGNIYSISEFNKLYDSMKKMSTDYTKLWARGMIALIKIIDAKDKYTAAHSQNVAKYSREIARKLGFSKNRVRNIYFAALLHDIGKIAVEDSILNKQGKLTSEEYQIIKQHPKEGYDFIKDIPAFVEAGIDKMIKYHHERMDGKGYYSVKAGKVDIGARIIAVADAFDAMVNERPYKKAMGLQQAVLELESNKGTQFDSVVVDAFLQVIQAKK
ncbi:MAG: HD domain-containing protein [Clostridia bacterium]|nr:HD domain-containing protein [Clostridia bacterium]